MAKARIRMTRTISGILASTKTHLHLNEFQDLRSFWNQANSGEEDGQQQTQEGWLLREPLSPLVLWVLALQFHFQLRVRLAPESGKILGDLDGAIVGRKGLGSKWARPVSGSRCTRDPSRQTLSAVNSYPSVVRMLRLNLHNTARPCMSAGTGKPSSCSSVGATSRMSTGAI